MKLTIKELNEMIMQEIAGAEEDPCLPAFYLSTPKSNKYVDKDGKKIARLAQKILKKALGKKEYDALGLQDPFARKEKSGSDDFMRKWIIHGAPNKLRPKLSQELAQALRETGLEAYSQADIESYEKCRATLKGDKSENQHTKKRGTLPSWIASKGNGVRLFFKMTDNTEEFWDFEFKPTKSQKKEGGINATAFEGNLLYGFRMAAAGADNANAYAEKMMGEANGISEDYLQAGVDIANHLLANYSIPSYNAEGCVKPSEGDYKLTKLYSSNGVSSGTPKTDIELSSDIRITVKELAGAQWASAEAAEAISIMQAALTLGADALLGPTQLKDLQAFMMQTMKKESVNLIKSAMQKAISGMSAKDKENERALQKGATVQLGMDVSGIEGVTDLEPEAFVTTLAASGLNKTVQKKVVKLIKENPPPINTEVQMAKAMEIATLENPDRDFAKKKITGREKEEARKILVGNLNKLQASLMSRAVDGISNNMRDIVKSKKARVAILKEAVTGEFKFIPRDAAPRYLLKWDASTPSKSYFKELDDAWFTAEENNMKMDIRGGKGGTSRDLRFGLTESRLLENLDPTMLMGNYLFEGETWDKFKGAAKKGVEAIKGGATDAWGWIKGGAQALLGKIKEVYEAIKKSILEMMSHIIDFITGLIKGPWTAFLSVLGLAPQTAQLAWGTGQTLEEQKKSLTINHGSYNMLVEMVENLMSEE